MTNPRSADDIEATNLLVWQAALPVLRELARRRIPVIVLKSLPQIEELYGHLQERLTEDVDLFVRGQDLDVVFEVCRAAGYVPKTGDHHPDFDTMRRDRGSETALREHKWTLVPAAGGGFDLDLHSDAIPRWRSAALRPYVWERVGQRERDGVRFLALSPEDRLIFLCWTIPTEAFLRRKTADIAQILRQGDSLDWAYIAARSRRLGLSLMVQLSCELTVYWQGPSLVRRWRQPLPLSLRWRRRLLLALLCRDRPSLGGLPGLVSSVLAYDHPLQVWLPAVFRRFRTAA